MYYFDFKNAARWEEIKSEREFRKQKKPEWNSGELVLNQQSFWSNPIVKIIN
jgi:hypothetical protein